MDGTHTSDELAALEQDTGLQFAGWLYDGRSCVPMLLKPEHIERRRVIVLALHAGVECGNR